MGWFKDKKKDFKYNTAEYVDCPACKGRGYIEVVLGGYKGAITCEMCLGTRKIRVDNHDK